MPLSFRSALAKFRTGVAPLRLETCHYEFGGEPKNMINCHDCVESENYVSLHSLLYEECSLKCLMKFHIFILNLYSETMMRKLY